MRFTAKRAAGSLTLALLLLAGCRAPDAAVSGGQTQPISSESSAPALETDSATAQQATGEGIASSSGASDKETSATREAPLATSKTTATTGKASQTAPKTEKTTETTTMPPVTYEDVKNVIRSEATDLRLTKNVLDRAIVNEGNAVRVANVIKKALRGEAVTIGFIGGSITEGSAASSAAANYVNRFRAWWSETFPNSSLSVCNAGKGATDSLMGVHRVETDLLTRNPDLVIVEFSVNDPDERLYRETYEGLIRRILKQSNTPGVICLFMMNDSGANRAKLHQPVGEHYDLPIISYQEALWPSGGDKLYAWSEISPDNIHPNDTGHAIVSELLIYYINTVREKLTAIPETVDALPAPLTANGYENALLLNSLNTKPVSLGSFYADAGTFQFGYGWTTNSGNNPFVLEVTDAKNISILYKASIDGAGAKATVKLDGKTVGTIDSDFSGGWGNYAGTFQVLEGTAAGKHRIEIQVNPEGSQNAFSILGILKS